VRAETLVESTMMNDADVNAVIDQAVRDIGTRYPWPFLAKTDTIPFVAAQQAYTLPSDLIKIATILIDGTITRLREVAAHTAWEAEGDTPPSGTPQTYFIWDNTLNVTPVPPASTGGLFVYYYRRPTALTDDTHIPEWAEEFHLLIADFVCQHLWHREEDFSKARVYGERYTEGIERMARYYLQRAEDTPFIMGDGLRARTPQSLASRFPFFP
jgi:hypothetical protein